MVMVKADSGTEAGALPSQELLAEMSRYNDELMNAGVLVAGEGMHPTAKGARVRFSGIERMVTRGPFERTEGEVATASKRLPRVAGCIRRGQSLSFFPVSASRGWF